MRLWLRHANGFLTALLILATATAQAQTTPAANRADLGANVSIDWSVVGPEGTPLNNPFTVGPATVSTVPNDADLTDDLIRIDQFPPGTWVGGFPAGDPLLWNIASAGPVTMVFSAPVKSVGADIESWDSGNYDGVLEVFDGGGSSLGSVSLVGVNGAQFIGIKSSNFDISKAVFSVTGSLGDPGLAINRVDLNLVPEPGALSLFLPGLAALGILRRRRR